MMMRLLFALVAIGCVSLAECRVKGLQRRAREEAAGRRALYEGCELVRYTVSINGANQIAPSTPIRGATGTADVVVRVVVPGHAGCEDEDRKKKKKKSPRKAKKKSQNKEYREEKNRDDGMDFRVEDGTFYACFEDATFLGIIPDFLRIHEGPLNENGPVVADFTLMLPGAYSFSFCKAVSMSVATKMVDDPAWYYVEANEITGDPSGLRAQLRQGLQFRLNAYPVMPFVAVPGGSGRAAVEFVAGGSRMCFEVELGNDFTPAFSGLYKGAVDANGELVIDFSPLVNRPMAGGCFEIDPALSADILFDPLNYYFQFHSATEGVNFYRVIRGTLGS